MFTVLERELFSKTGKPFTWNSFLLPPSIVVLLLFACIQFNTALNEKISNIQISGKDHTKHANF